MTLLKKNNLKEFSAIDWLRVGGFNTVIALFLTAIDFGGGFMTNFIFSQCIGLSMACAIRIALRRTRAYSLLVQLAGLMTAMLAGVLTGAVGAAIVSGAFNNRAMNTESRPTTLAILLISILFASIITYIFLSRERIRISEDQVREERLQRLDREKKLTDTTLRLLQAQIEPHFLFNTLATVLSRIDSNSEQAKKILMDLDRYLRTTLSRTREESTTLGQEIELLTAYLDIFQIRMGERLTYSVEIAEELLSHPLPPLLLQPLVENSIKHGLEPSKTGGKIVIRGEEANNLLLLTVADTGRGMQPDRTPGVGLANIRDRLASLYGEAGRLIITENSPSGIIATLEIPYVAR